MRNLCIQYIYRLRDHGLMGIRCNNVEGSTTTAPLTIL